MAIYIPRPEYSWEEYLNNDKKVFILPKYHTIKLMSFFTEMEKQWFIFEYSSCFTN